MSPTFTHQRVLCIELKGCVKILFNYLDQNQRCNCRLDIFESQLQTGYSLYLLRQLASSLELSKKEGIDILNNDNSQDKR